MADAMPTNPVSTTAILDALEQLRRQILDVVVPFRQQGPSPLATFDFEKKSPNSCVHSAASSAKLCSTTSKPMRTRPGPRVCATPARLIGVVSEAPTPSLRCSARSHYAVTSTNASSPANPVCSLWNWPWVSRPS